MYGPHASVQMDALVILRDRAFTENFQGCVELRTGLARNS